MLSRRDPLQGSAVRLAAGGDPGGAREGRPEAQPSSPSPIRFLQLSSSESGPRRVDPRPRWGWDRPSHALPERRLPAEHHMFLGTDMLLGVTPIASRYGVGQRPVVHRLQSLPRPLRGRDGGLLPRRSGLRPADARGARSSRGSPVFRPASTAWGLLLRGGATDKVAFWRACRCGRPKGLREGSVCGLGAGGPLQDRRPSRCS